MRRRFSRVSNWRESILPREGEAYELWHPGAVRSDALRHTLTGVRALAQQSVAGQQLGPGEHLTVVAIETARLQSPTSKFSVEASAGIWNLKSICS